MTSFSNEFFHIYFLMTFPTSFLMRFERFLKIIVLDTFDFIPALCIFTQKKSLSMIGSMSMIVEPSNEFTKLEISQPN